MGTLPPTPVRGSSDPKDPIDPPRSIVVGRGLRPRTTLETASRRLRRSICNPHSTQLSFGCDYVAPPNRSLNRFSRTPQPQTGSPPPLKHRSTDPPHASPLSFSLLSVKAGDNPPAKQLTSPTNTAKANPLRHSVGSDSAAYACINLRLFHTY